jgi:cytochrome c oxidase subunit 3
LGFRWPPTGIQAFNPFGIPLLNTTILLTSGLTVTWRHHALLKRDHSQRVVGLFLTILLGVYFTVIQGYEYLEARFSFADAVYGSCFFIATGFHGLHVLIGRLFLSVTLIRIVGGQFSRAHHFGFEAAA